MRKYYVLLIFNLLLFPAQVHAGCPYYEEEMSVEILEYKFYDAKSDAAFIEKLDENIRNFFKENTEQENLTKKETLISNNTGVIIQGKINSSPKVDELFYASKAPDVCKNFSPATINLKIHRACPMVFFEAPTNLIIVKEKDIQPDKN